ncbi:AAA+ ATPase domain-containing protein, partial [Tanacetum coccineum]
ILGSDGTLMSTQEYIQKVVEDEGFKSGAWVSAIDYVNANGGTSCSLNVIGDLTVTIKDLSSIIPGTIHHKVIGDGGYEKDITVGAALILANVLVFSPKSSMHYLNITKRNVVKVFRKDTVPKSGSG